MDEGAGQIRDEIREDVSDILRTRLAMAEKLELLEARLQATAEETKAAVLEVVDNVRDTAEDFVDRTKHTLNPVYQVQQHPWIMLGAAIVGGFLLARAGGHRASSNGNGSSASGAMMPGGSPGTPAEAREHGVAYGSRARMSVWQQGVMDELMDQVQNELHHIQGALVVAARTFLRDMARQALRLIADPPEGAVSDRGIPNEGIRRPRY